MARVRTLLQLRESARQRADEEFTTFVSDEECNSLINASIAMFRNELSLRDPNLFLGEPYSIPVVAGTFEYVLPDDFLEARRVDLVRGDTRIMLDRFEITDPSYTTRGSPEPWSSPREIRYCIARNGADGSEAVVLFDRDPGNNEYLLTYVVLPPDLEDDADFFDGVAGWEEWVIIDVAIKMGLNGNMDVSGLERMFARYHTQIMQAAGARDSGRAPQVVDVRPSRYLSRYPRMR